MAEVAKTETPTGVPRLAAKTHFTLAQKERDDRGTKRWSKLKCSTKDESCLESVEPLVFLLQKQSRIHRFSTQTLEACMRKR